MCTVVERVGKGWDECDREGGKRKGLGAFKRDKGARRTTAHRPGQRAARMEIRPDRFKAVAGKTLGEIHR